MKKKEVVKILEENKLTNIWPTTTNNVAGERIKVEDLSEPVKDFLGVAKKEQRELDESMKESRRQTEERKEKEQHTNPFASFSDDLQNSIKDKRKKTNQQMKGK